MASPEQENAESFAEKELVDIPSDFFDEFSTKEFLDGLSVIDSWDDDRSTKPSHDTPGTSGKYSKKERRSRSNRYSHSDDMRFRNKNHRSPPSHQRSSKLKRNDRSQSKNLDEYIQPGSRRDPNKTIMAIKKDKEVKLKEFLSKALESSNDIRPPGTELDEYYDDSKGFSEKDKEMPVDDLPSKEKSVTKSEYPSKRESLNRQDKPSWYGKRKSLERNSNRFYRQSPDRRQFHSSNLRSPSRHWSPYRNRSSRWRSPERRRSRDRRRSSERRRSPYRRRSPDYRRSFNRRSPDERSLNNSYSEMQSNLSGGYPAYYGSTGAYNQYQVAYPYGHSGVNTYPSEYSSPYEYAAPPGGYATVAAAAAAPQRAAAPAPAFQSAPIDSTVALPQAAAAPSLPIMPTKSFDTLEQLLIEGKITEEEYRKLTPTPSRVLDVASAVPQTVTADVLDKVKVLGRCQDAVNKLAKLHLPNRLVLHASAKPSLPRSLSSKSFSPLKFQSIMEFQFTSANSAAVEKQNKQLVDSIVATMGLDQVVQRPERRAPCSSRHVAVQTARPYCDICDIRESTQFRSVGTSPEPNTAPPQPPVVSEELLRKAASILSSAPAHASSIAHLTPALIMQQDGAAAGRALLRTPHPHHYLRRHYEHSQPHPRFPKNYNNYKY